MAVGKKIEKGTGEYSCAPLALQITRITASEGNPLAKSALHEGAVLFVVLLNIGKFVPEGQQHICINAAHMHHPMGLCSQVPHKHR